MAAAAGLSITLMPVVMGYFIRGKIPEETKNPINRFLIALYMPIIKWFVNIRLATSGGDNTLSRGVTRGTGPNPFENVHGAGYRGVYDFADPDSSVFIISTGQSGHPLSRFYDNLGENDFDLFELTEEERAELANAFKDDSESGDELDDENLPLFFTQPRFEWTGGGHCCDTRHTSDVQCRCVQRHSKYSCTELWWKHCVYI